MSEHPITATRPGAPRDAGETIAASRILTPAARRALEEARTRRAASDSQPQTPIPEIDGRNGPEPVRYGDWEIKGLATDF